MQMGRQLPLGPRIVSNTCLSIPRIRLSPAGFTLKCEFEITQLTMIDGRRVQNDEIRNLFGSIILPFPNLRQPKQRELESEQGLCEIASLARWQTSGRLKEDKNGSFPEVDHEGKGIPEGCHWVDCRLVQPHADIELRRSKLLCDVSLEWWY